MELQEFWNHGFRLIVETDYVVIDAVLGDVFAQLQGNLMVIDQPAEPTSF